MISEKSPDLIVTDIMMPFQSGMEVLSYAKSLNKKTRVIVLEAGRIVFEGSVEDFTKSELPAIKEMLTLDRHDHSNDPEFTNPWDKRRRPAEAIL